LGQGMREHVPYQHLQSQLTVPMMNLKIMNIHQENARMLDHSRVRMCIINMFIFFILP